MSSLFVGLEIFALAIFGWFVLGVIAAAIFWMRTNRVVEPEKIGVTHLCVTFVYFLFGPLTLLFAAAGLVSDMFCMFRGKPLEDWI